MLVIVYMHGMHLGSMDMNLLRVLDVLLKQGSVTAASKTLGLSQSATSHALARLRKLLGDPLLVRSHRGWIPTARALALAGPLHQALATLEDALVTPEPFEPLLSERRFTVATSDYAELVLVPRLAQHFSRVAPNIGLWIRPLPDIDATVPMLETLDAAIGLRAPGLGVAHVFERKLFDEQFVCLVRRGHAALKKRWTPESFAALRHAFIAPRGNPGGAVDDALSAVGLSRKVVVAVPHFLVAPFIVSETDLVLTVPERVAQTFSASLPLEIVAPPVRVPGFAIGLYWHERLSRDPAQLWFREQIVNVVRDLPYAGAAEGGKFRRRASKSQSRS
jgi:DNA-binding transcriptional LysR family regulator